MSSSAGLRSVGIGLRAWNGGLFLEVRASTHISCFSPGSGCDLDSAELLRITSCSGPVEQVATTTLPAVMNERAWFWYRPSYTPGRTGSLERTSPGGCERTTLRDPEDLLFAYLAGISTDNTRVYWMEAGSVCDLPPPPELPGAVCDFRNRWRLLSLPLETVAPDADLLVISEEFWPDGAAPAVGYTSRPTHALSDGSNVYWATDGRLYRVQPSGGVPLAVVVNEDVRHFGLTPTSVVIQTLGGLLRVAKDGVETIEIVPGEVGPWVTDGEAVYFADVDKRTIQRVMTTGGRVQRMWTLLGDITSLAVDEKNLYALEYVDGLPRATVLPKPSN